MRKVRGKCQHYTARPKIHSHSQIFRCSQSIFCLPHRPKFSDFFDFCLHWVSVVCGLELRIAQPSKWKAFFVLLVNSDPYLRNSLFQQTKGMLMHPCFHKLSHYQNISWISRENAFAKIIKTAFWWMYFLYWKTRENNKCRISHHHTTIFPSLNFCGFEFLSQP